MQKSYEYKLFRLSVDPIDIIGYGDPNDPADSDTQHDIYIHRTLNHFGSEGWDLVQISGHLVTMKRCIS